MPTYEFECKKCKNTFTEILSIDDRNKPIKCKCGKEATRVITTVNLTGFDNLGRSK